MGVRSFRSIATRALSIRVDTPVGDFDAAIADSLAAGVTPETASYDVPIGDQAFESFQWSIDLVLYEQVNDRQFERDRVRMETPVDLSGEFQVTDLDYVKDTDGDGVGDVNERLEGTDPADAQSTPGSSTIDVLAFYTPEFNESYSGNATSRIQHVFALAEDIYGNSDVDIRFRLVGAVQVPVDESSGHVDFHFGYRDKEAERHGADLIVLFAERNSGNSGTCGVADLGGKGERGHFEFSRERRNHAMVIGSCGASTLAHELGHLMGLGHSAWQAANAPTGTWRWSRGHGVEHDFGTIMTYGPPASSGRRLEVVSDPVSLCTGTLEDAKPCGINRVEVNGADAATSLNAVRYQIAAFRESQSDADEDGFVDSVDVFPNDSGDWWDADDDGVGDNADTDDDNDGVPDDGDAFPYNGAETADSDGDGVGDNADPFPLDPAESSDVDGDGVGDKSDIFPDDPLEWIDTDGDGAGDNGDLWPMDPAESADTDGDGIGDNADPDADNDGVADEFDAHPLDAARTDLASYLFTGESEGDQAGEILSPAGNGDSPGFLIGVPQHDVNGSGNAGAAYLVSSSDLVMLDAADGNLDRIIELGHVHAGTDSWKFVGEAAGDQAGKSLVSSGDMDGDGHTDVLVGSPYNDNRKGAVYFVSGADFTAADAADGVSDHTIRLGHVASYPGSWKIVGEAWHDEAGIGLAFVSDTDGDGKPELLIGAWQHGAGERQRAGATYLLGSGDLALADAADGVSDGVIGLGHVAGQPASWKLIGESAGDYTGFPLSSPGDLDGDGVAETAINSRNAVYLLSAADLASADAADGQADHVLDARYIAGQPKSWKLHGGGSVDFRWNSRPMSTIDNESGAGSWLIFPTLILYSETLQPTDAADGHEDGVVDLGRLGGPPDSWNLRFDHLVPVGDTDGNGGANILANSSLDQFGHAFLFPPSILGELDAWRLENGFVDPYDLENTAGVQRIFGAYPFGQIGISTAGDTDGDGVSDILLGDPGRAVDHGRGAVYLVLGDELAALDRIDRLIDDRLHLADVAGDTDGDGVSNTIDPDDDGDGVPDSVDAFQLDPEEWRDLDRDGVGDNADAFPNNYFEWIDTDGDGLGDFRADDDDDGDGIADSEDAYPLDTDNDGIENAVDPDDDNDGTLDTRDALPIDPTESADTDGDGLGNNADPDDDNDGVADDEDALPLDPRETVDTDADGVGDNADAFPSDPNESGDHDADGVGDNADPDDDNDGILDAEDQFPLDAGASNDTDGDGVADSRDAFPDNALESADTDGDGIGDNADTDADNDGVEAPFDLFPLDASRSDLTSMRLEVGVPVVDFGWIEISAAGDLDGDGKQEFLVAAPDTTGEQAVFIVGSEDLANADSADGALDGSANLLDALTGMQSWKLVNEYGFTIPGSISPFGDLTGDGFGEFFVSISESTPVGYIVSGADLLTADAADSVADGVIDMTHIASQPASWKFRSYWSGGPVSASVPAGLDHDGTVGFALGRTGSGDGGSGGSVDLISADSLPMLDALDGSVDGTVGLASISRHVPWRLIGEAPGDQAGTSPTLTDFNGDGLPDLVVGAPFNATNLRNQGAVYLIDSADLAAADLADGSADRQIELARVRDQPGSFKLVVEVENGHLGSAIATGDFDGDKREDLVLASRDSAGWRVDNLLSGLPESLAEMDQADGAADGLVNLTHSRSPDNIQISGTLTESIANVFSADFDDDGRGDIVMGIERNQVSMVAHLIAASALFGENDRATADVVDVNDPIARSVSYRIYAPETQSINATGAIAAAGDVDADGLGDILIGVLAYASTVPAPPAGVVYLVMAADLPPLDAADGRVDGRIFLSNIGRGMNLPAIGRPK